ncbi:MAG TPA: hypothetical protein VN416_00625 [Desulfomonilia bacterium]|nr:hypothetical protein [Desulfomonilia bacterium]
MRRSTLIIAAVLIAAGIASLTLWDKPRYRIELALERADIEQAAQAYFKAEMERDYKKLYTYLAPSSTYRRTHTYDQFLQDVSGTPVTIRTYRIVDIYRLRGNHDPATYPAVKRFVQVEVDVDVGFTDTGTTSTCNYCFTFLKEGDRWYKG